MIYVTRKAVSAIRERFEGDGNRPVCVRIVPKGRPCSVYLSLSADNRRESDEVLELDDVTLVADRLLVHSLGGIQINYDASHWGGGNLAIRPLVNLETGTCGDCRC